MRRYLWIALVLCLSMSAIDAPAQSFLNKLGKAIKNEVENRVTKEVEKEVKKVLKKEDKTKQQPQEQPQEQSTSNQSQSFDDANERHLKILEERGEIVRPIIVENPAQDMAPATGKTNGHEWVDLGLPSGTRWATCNIDASQPHQPGGLYAWGEKATKTSYMPDNSKTHGKDMDDFSGDVTYDVATAKWGKGWRMPTKEEFDELVEYCPFPRYVKQNGRYGQLFTNELNGRTLFLPTTGSKEWGSEHQEANGCGLYWTSTPHKDSYKNGAHQYHYGAALGEMGIGERSSGYAVRAVIDNDALTVIPAQGETNGHEWVDLGLPSGTKWATCNIGTKSAEDYGKCYQWSKITPSHEDFVGRNDAQGKKMGDIGGNATYDAATASWGKGWRIPTEAEFKELMEYCTWEYTQMGRATGCKVISKINGNYIFFPIEFYEKIARYWSSTPSKYQGDNESHCLTINKESISIGNENRSEIFAIRPVTK